MVKIKPELKNNNKAINITFEPCNTHAINNYKETFLDTARKSGVRLAAICGGRGLCRACEIQIINGSVPIPSKQDSLLFTDEEINDGWRRACQCSPIESCTVDVPKQNRAVSILNITNSTEVDIQPDPIVHVYRARVPMPTLENPQADDQRLLVTLNKKTKGIAQTIDHAVKLDLSSIFDNTNGSVKAVIRLGEIIGLLPIERSPLIGLAIDLGTTSIGILLVNLRKGQTLASRAVENPQTIYGGDILSRINCILSNAATLETLQQIVIEKINQTAKEMCHDLSLDANHIADIVIAGNTVMHHILMGLPVKNLTQSPFAPTISFATDVKIRELDLIGLPGAYVHFMPNIAGYVGGDHSAAILAFQDTDKTHLLLDIGTNTELSLLKKNSITTVSCPSGPALEGGNIQCGMRSADGAIESIDFSGDDFKLNTINNSAPVGICGSGILDIIAKLCCNNIIDPSGKLIENHPRIRTTKDIREFVLSENVNKKTRDIVLTQLDVRAVQLAKSAIKTAIDTLLDDASITIKDIDQIIIAGTFGNYINIESAQFIGMIPNISTDAIAQVGNASAIGAKVTLISYSHRVEAQTIANNARYIELSTSADFNRKFVDNLILKRTGE